ncbi:hypothetical protein [Muricoccus nepalensis]|uniref:hypothetical protein n=1 Tax=Muricoccus nepalensis TaxID=1854500 RepID=UPI001386BF2F|nr:hypothetical protein [Roseomonas nepalensis]
MPVREALIGRAPRRALVSERPGVLERDRERADNARPALPARCLTAAVPGGPGRRA